LPESGGDFTDEKLRRTLSGFTGVGADDKQPTKVRFLRNVQRVVHKRSLADSSESLPAVFLLNVTGRVPTEARRVSMIDYGDKRLEGQVWYVGPNLGFARAVEHDCADNIEALFDCVIETLGEGATPAVLYMPGRDKSSVRFYPSGLVDEDDFELYSVVERVVSLDEVLEALDRLHQNQLVTTVAQSAGNRLWEDSNRYRPVANAELVAQSYVETTLWAHFHHCKVKVEGTEKSGRFDVALLGPNLPGDPTTFRCYVVLELKVLRSFGVRGGVKRDRDNHAWIASGVDQAHAYAQDMKTNAKALCCFDMRQTDTGNACFAHVKSRAASLGVVLRRWYLYGRLADYRAAVGDEVTRAVTSQAQ
jgi:hypothetical protein